MLAVALLAAPAAAQEAPPAPADPAVPDSQEEQAPPAVEDAAVPDSQEEQAAPAVEDAAVPDSQEEQAAPAVEDAAVPDGQEAPAAPAVERLSGPDRITTAVAVSQRAFPEGAPAVVLARADEYPDALAGAPLAAGLTAPILLTGRDELAPAVAGEIARLGAGQAVLLGGAAALGPAVEAALPAAGVAEIVRYAGADRFDTARLVAEAVLERSGATQVYLTLGGHPDPARGWPDAVALSALAATEQRPVLLTGPEQLSPRVLELLDDRAVESVVVAGGPAAVSEALLEPLRARVPVDRVAGEDRYATSAAIAARALEGGADAGRVWVATGRAPADALAGGAAVAALGGVLLLADGHSTAEQPALSFVEQHAGQIDGILVLGGETAVPESFSEQMAGLLPEAGGAVIPAAPLPLAASAVRIRPGTNVQAVVDAHAPGTRFVFASGVHRLAAVRARDRDVFLGDPGAVLSGARLLSPAAFRSDSAGRWAIGGQTQSASRSGDYGSSPWYENNNHYAEPGSEAEVHFGEELFVNGQRQRRMNAEADVRRPGTWYFDLAGDRIVMFDNPAGKTVETSVTETAFSGAGVSYVTISNLTIRNYANRAQRGALDATGTRGWTIRNVTVEANHGGGLGVGDTTQVRASRVVDNGQIGLVGGGRASTVASSEIAYNRQLGFQLHWEAGGTKFVQSQGLHFLNNWVHHNRGIGVWFDIDNRDAVISSNLIEHNEVGGLLWEISYGADISYNELRDNHVSGDMRAAFGNIQIVSSDGVEVHHNVVRGSGTQELMLNHQDRGPGLRNTFVHDNDVAITTSWGGGTTGLNDQGAGDPYAPAANNRFERNTYRLASGSNAAPFAWLSAKQSPEQWLRTHPTDRVLRTDAPGTLPVPAAGGAGFSAAEYGAS